MGNDFEIWKQHFIKQARGLIPHQDKFYTVSTENGRNTSIENGSTTVNLVSPMQQVVERAKSDISNPPNIYDPVTGVIHHSSGKPRSVRKSPKKKTSGTRKKSKKKKTAPSKKKKKDKKSKGKSTVNKKKK